jgi:hypothetical protein
MSYLAGMLLIYMEPYLAFQCFANLLSQRFLRIQFRMEVDLIHKYIKGPAPPPISCHGARLTVGAVYDTLLQRYLPRVRKHLHGFGVNHDMYLLEWWLTVFSKARIQTLCAVACVADVLPSLGAAADHREPCVGLLPPGRRLVHIPRFARYKLAGVWEHVFCDADATRRVG